MATREINSDSAAQTATDALLSRAAGNSTVQERNAALAAFLDALAGQHDHKEYMQEGVLEVLAKWLGEEAARTEALLSSPIVLSLLKILSILPLTVDLLVHYKYGRVIKKIIKAQPQAADATTAAEVHALAGKLFDRWTEMALDAERQEQEALSQQPPAASVPTQPPASAPTQPPASAPTQPPASAPAQPPAPESAKAQEPAIQKRQADSEESEKALKKKARHVCFPSDPDALIKIITFIRDPHEWEYLGTPTESSINAALFEMVHADRNEAAIAFKQFHELENEEAEETEKMLKVLLKWPLPLPIAGIPGNASAGNESEEKNAQAQRERTVLSVAFYSQAEIPESPTEPLFASPTSPSAQPKTIPFWDPATDTLLVQKSFRFGPRNEANYSASPSASTKDAPGNAPVLDTAFLASFFSSPPAFPSSLAPSFDAYPSTSPPMGRRPSYPPSPNPAHASVKNSRCRFYRSGQPGSCRFGDSCTFLHQDD